MPGCFRACRNGRAWPTLGGWCAAFSNLLLTVAAGLALGYGLHVHFAPPKVPTPFERLSTRVEGDINNIFSPLEGEGAPMPTQDLRTLRETFQDGISTAPRNQRPMYGAAVMICDQLLESIQEREKFLIRLKDNRSKPSSANLAKPAEQVSSGAYYPGGGYGSSGYNSSGDRGGYGAPREGYRNLAPASLPRVAVSTGLDQQRETSRLNTFFEGAVKNDWANKSAEHRRQVADRYSRLRALERTHL